MTVKIRINGPIVSNDDKWFYNWLEMDATCPKDVTNALPDNGEDVEVSINSYGGLVDEGNEIYTELMSYPGQVNVNVIMAGSAASVIAMAGKPTKISPVGQIMIHNVSMMAGGDYHDMDKASEILRKSNESIANAYMLKTGLSKEDLLAKMNRETWLTADEAVELGFADEKMFESNERPALVADGGAGLIPQPVIDKVKELKNDIKPTDNVASESINADEFVERITQNVLEKINETETQNQNMENQESPDENKSSFERFLF